MFCFGVVQIGDADALEFLELRDVNRAQPDKGAVAAVVLVPARFDAHHRHHKLVLHAVFLRHTEGVKLQFFGQVDGVPLSVVIAVGVVIKAVVQAHQRRVAELLVGGFGRIRRG